MRYISQSKLNIHVVICKELKEWNEKDISGKKWMRYGSDVIFAGVIQPLVASCAKLTWYLTIKSEPNLAEKLKACSKSTQWVTRSFRAYKWKNPKSELIRLQKRLFRNIHNLTLSITRKIFTNNQWNWSERVETMLKNSRWQTTVCSFAAHWAWMIFRSKKANQHDIERHIFKLKS